jgi:hypothetical protein
MRTLDPRIHDETPRVESIRLSMWGCLMDCRVKPGNDSGEVVRGLDPRIHDLRLVQREDVDGRVFRREDGASRLLPGHDSGEGRWVWIPGPALARRPGMTACKT